MAAAAIWQWYQTSQRQQDLIVVTATTNHAIQNAARSFFKLANKLPNGTVVFLQSTAAELQLVTTEDQVWCNCRVPELLKNLIEKMKDTMETGEKEAIVKYLRKKLGHNGEAFREHFAFERIPFHFQPKIIFGTTVVVAKFAEQLVQNG